MKSTLIFFVNGKKVVDQHVDPEVTLLQYLRLKLRLCGTKLGCGEGGCGACTVMVSRFNRLTDTIEHLAVNACLTPVCAVHGQAVTTTEGIGSTKTRLHPVQERIAKWHGSQCGFCTPGIVMSMYTLLRNSPQPTMQDIETCFQGNLCRCTGYRPILEGFKTFTNEKCCGGKTCCQMNENTSTALASDFIPYDPSQEPIFPPELMLNEEYDSEDIYFKSKRVKWIRPNNLESLLKLTSQYPNAKLVVGNSEIGVEVKFKKCYYPVIIAATNVPELFHIQKTETGITLGVSNTLSTLEKVLQKTIAEEPTYKTRTFVALVETLQQFAGKQIRNVASIAGNIMTASPISDLNPIFMATNCILQVASTDCSDTIRMDEHFFTGYRKTVLKFEQVILSIHIPFTQQDEYVSAFKQARRYDDDIAIANCGTRVLFQPQSNIIQEISLAYGGMAPTTVMAKETMHSLIGRTWDANLIEDASKLLGSDLPLDPSAPGGMVEFRRSLATSFFFKFYLAVGYQLELEGVITMKAISKRDHSAIDVRHRGIIKSSQIYLLAPPGHPTKDCVGQPIVHLSAAKQATGEAVYCDDIPHFENELYLAMVTSTRSHAKILYIDPSEALLIEGVEAFFCHRDIAPKNNIIGPVFKDEEVFASKTVTCQGQLIGVIVALDQATAQSAACKVKIEYDDVEPIILTIEDAIKRNAFNRKFDKRMCRGDLVNGFTIAEKRMNGMMRMGGQEHFYLETNCAIAVPKGEDGEIEIIASTQNPTEIQNEAAHVLGVSSNRVVCKVKRLGGGFGGKETRGHIVALPCAFAAHRLNRPVRCMLDRDEDMAMSGTRHPFLGKYEVGFMNDGRILAFDATFYSNRGNSMDLSLAVLERAIFSCDNAYHIPNMCGQGSLCTTNISSNTAFRGFGAPQGMMLTESMMHDVATSLQMDPAKIREINLYDEEDSTHFNQKLINCTIRQCWQECLQMSDYWSRRHQIESFNKENRWKKRGLAIIPTKFGISFTVKFMNQGGAMIHIYKDGSVLLTHGGTEMGQGLHTKMIQVASKALGIPISKIHISETSTDKVPNTSPTAASASSDLNGMAILDACSTLKGRLQPIIAANPTSTWEDWISAAYFERISLSATGFYRTPGLNYDPATNSGNAFSYFTYGVGCSEVEIDCLTGDHKVLRTDIVMDVGQSLNPTIDIGQIEGAFVQGYGLFVMEELRHSPSGFLYTRGPGMYKIPSFNDIPSEFNVALLKGAQNPRAVYSSKAIGEPPLFLAASVFFAIKDAIQQARQEEGVEGIFELQSPATAERIRLACQDRFTRQFPPAPPGTFKPWSVAC